MPAIKHRQPNASPEVEYGEINIPDDKNLGTGTFTTLLKPNALLGTKTISSIMINAPRFQISVNINPGTKEIPVLLGRADADHISGKIFLLSANIDPTVSHTFVAAFENGQVLGLELDGTPLKVK